MGDFFSNFTFAEAMRHPSSKYDADRATMNVSPTTVLASPLPSRLPTPPPCTIGDLAHRFHQQSLRVDSTVAACYAYEPLTPPSDGDFAFSDHFPPSSGPSSSAHLRPAELREQRQFNTRMQCVPSHVRDITDLVQKMIDDGDQCHMCESPRSRSRSRTPSSSSGSEDVHEDEGVDMDYASPPSPSSPPLHPLRYRRSGDRVIGHAAVSKSVRMRKKPKMLKRPTSK